MGGRCSQLPLSRPLLLLLVLGTVTGEHLGLALSTTEADACSCQAVGVSCKAGEDVESSACMDRVPDAVVQGQTGPLARENVMLQLSAGSLEAGWSPARVYREPDGSVLQLGSEFEGSLSSLATRNVMSCRTARPGEDCYAAVDWAMRYGTKSNPQWYPGLTASSSFEEFQDLFYSRGTNNNVCSTAACPAATVTDVDASQLSAACEAVIQNVAQDSWSSATCASRIDRYQRADGGSLSQQEARAQVALEFTACAACWPWKKYKDSGDTRISGKRGIAIQDAMLSEASLDSLAGAVSWGKTWDSTAGLEGGPDLDAWERTGLRFVPMVWGSRKLPGVEASGLPPASAALLGFNEPNFPAQADLSPQQAASLWPRLEQLAARAGIATLVSPAVGLNPNNDAVRWLQDFLRACQGCKVDAVAFHSYTCYGRWLKEHIDQFRTFGKPIWITELACSDPQSPERLNMDGQMAYMREAIPLLEQDPDVHMYAWFSYFQDQWAFPIVSGANGDAGLVHSDGSLSRLGALYASFATSRPMEAPPASQSVNAAEGAFTPVDGGVDRACRGASSADNSDGYYQVFSQTWSLGSCRALCAAAPVCKGLEHSASRGRCEVWTRSAGIGSSRPASGFTCLRYEAPCRTAEFGEACYNAVTWAKDIGIKEHPQWYPGMSRTSSFADFQAFLHRTGANNGVCAKLPC